MTGMATATFPDGSIPEAIDVARIAANLFAAGQETTVRLFGTALQRIGDDHELQQLLREHRELIPNFVEECLRIESPVKGDFRLARVTTELGGVTIPAGTTRHGRQRRREPRSRAASSVPPTSTSSAPTRASTSRSATARTPVRVPRSPAPRAASPSSDCSTGWTTSGSPRRSTARAGARRYDYVPTYILRGVSRLHLEFDPRI